MNGLINQNGGSVALHGAEHQRMISQCNRLWTIASLIHDGGKEALDADSLAEIIFYFGGEARLHHQLEEQVDFPHLLSLPLGDIEREPLQSLVNALTTDHRELDRLWKIVLVELKSAAQGGCSARDMRDIATFITLYRHHVHREEFGILPIVHSHLLETGGREAGATHERLPAVVH